jgi:hypothetical protein
MLWSLIWRGTKSKYRGTALSQEEYVMRTREVRRSDSYGSGRGKYKISEWLAVDGDMGLI